jgi:putative aldouronate transport system permease protein
MKNQGVLFEIRKNKFLYLLALPGIVYFLIFSYLPMVGNIIAFKNFNAGLGIFRSKWVGFENFRFLFTSDKVISITINTVCLNALFIAAEIFFAVLTAVLLNELRSFKLKKTLQTFIFLPYFISWIVVGVFAYNLFNSQSGFLNHFFNSIGLQSVSWYERADLWPVILVAAKVWKYVGYESIIYLAAIAGIDPAYYEALELDGGTKLQSIRYITIPMIMPTITIMALLAVGRIFFADFGMFYALIGDNAMLFPTTEVIDTFVYRSLKELGDVGMSSAVGLYQSTVGLVLVFLSNWAVKKYSGQDGIF